MKTTDVIYLGHGEDNGKVVKRFLIETKADIEKALKNKIITPLHVRGMQAYIDKGTAIVLNASGGYCPLDGITWGKVDKK